MTGTEVVQLIASAVALAVSVVALVASRRAALSAERSAARSLASAERAEALRPTRRAPQGRQPAGTVTTRPDGGQTLHLGDMAPGESRTIRVRPPR